jgi:hypothetical protein
VRYNSISIYVELNRIYEETIHTSSYRCQDKYHINSRVDDNLNNIDIGLPSLFGHL